MKLKDQVCSFELAKKLKELGVKQDSLFYWVDVAGYHEVPELPQPEPTWILVNPISGKDEMNEDAISAFTVAELGEMLPAMITQNEIHYCVVSQNWSGFLGESWRTVYLNAHIKKELHYEFGNTEADARAKMLIYLLENKTIKETNNEM